MGAAVAMPHPPRVAPTLLSSRLLPARTFPCCILFESQQRRRNSYGSSLSVNQNLPRLFVNTINSSRWQVVKPAAIASVRRKPAPRFSVCINVIPRAKTVGLKSFRELEYRQDFQCSSCCKAFRLRMWLERCSKIVSSARHYQIYLRFFVAGDVRGCGEDTQNRYHEPSLGFTVGVKTMKT